MGRPARTAVFYMTQRRREILRVFLDAGEGDVTAYDIVDKRGMNYVSVHHVLRRMYQHGWAVRRRGSAGRLSYTLTPLGRESAEDILHEWEQS